MEADFWEIVLGHLEDVVGVGEEDITPLAVDGHKLVLALLECLKSLRAVALYPTCLVEGYRLPSYCCSIFMEQTVLYYLKLELSDGAYDFTAVKLVDKKLRHALVHQLLDAFIKLL